MNQLNHEQFESLFLRSTHLIDVRAPVEFAEGSIPGAINLPLLNDEERHLIGITYKNKGQLAAIDLGHQLVSGTIREERLHAWKDEIKKHPDAIIYCFRGGLRSRTTQQWLKESGIQRPLITGGYKALRQFLIHKIEEKCKTLEFIVVSGPTGSGKTNYLYSSKKPFIDLESIAKHRGSAFGAMTQPQPSQIDFENILAVNLIRAEKLNSPILIESESKKIGKSVLPEILYQKIKSSPKITLEVSMNDRIENIFKEYVDETKFDNFRRSIQSISKKLGGTRTQEILHDINLSEVAFVTGNGLDSNRTWIRKLLEWYYDPLYRGQYKNM